jgi:hypothetical protein
MTKASVSISIKYFIMASCPESHVEIIQNDFDSFGVTLYVSNAVELLGPSCQEAQLHGQNCMCV